MRKGVYDPAGVEKLVAPVETYQRYWTAPLTETVMVWLGLSTTMRTAARACPAAPQRNARAGNRTTRKRRRFMAPPDGSLMPRGRRPRRQSSPDWGGNKGGLDGQTAAIAAQFRDLRRLLAQQLAPDARVPSGAHGPRLVLVLGHAGQGLDHPLLGKGHDHLGAVAKPALELEGAVMQLGQALGDGKSE